MVTSVAFFLALVGAVYAARLVELRVSGRNARRLFSAGGVEAGGGHYRVMVIFHAVYPAACAAEVYWLHRPFPALLGWGALGLVVAAQALRWSCIRTLAGRWTTRVIVVPGALPVTGGPYRLLRHPNYLAVIAEVAALPLVHGAWLAALLGSVINAGLLVARIRCEERALGAAWQAAFAHRPRLVPEVPRD
jgi:methyltransferase